MTLKHLTVNVFIPVSYKSIEIRYVLIFHSHTSVCTITKLLSVLYKSIIAMHTELLTLKCNLGGHAWSLTAFAPQLQSE